jgi:microcystin degradation protein MlrC
VEQREPAFGLPVLSPEAAVRQAMQLAQRATRPVVIADTQDNPGAGGDSDTTGMLRALLACGAQRAALGLMVDAQAAMAALRARDPVAARAASALQVRAHRVRDLDAARAA